jgi:hypothetical protein
MGSLEYRGTDKGNMSWRYDGGGGGLGSKGVALFICNVGAKWEWVVNVHTATALPPGRSPATHRERDCVGPRACLKECGEENFLSSTGFRAPNRPPRSEWLF